MSLTKSFKPANPKFLRILIQIVEFPGAEKGEKEFIAELNKRSKDRKSEI